MEEEDETSLDDILDELDRDFGRREQERKKKSGGSPVYINVYDMVRIVLSDTYVYLVSCALKARDGS